MLRLQVPITMAAVAEAEGELDGWLAAHGVAPAAAYRTRLVVEELLTNLVRHGRFDGPAPPAWLELGLREQELRLVIEDAAAPFDPRLAPPTPPPSLDDDRIGGLGLALVLKMADCLAYGRTATGWNRTELRIAAE